MRVKLVISGVAARRSGISSMDQVWEACVSRGLNPSGIQEARRPGDSGTQAWLVDCEPSRGANMVACEWFCEPGSILRYYCNG